MSLQELKRNILDFILILSGRYCPEQLWEYKWAWEFRVRVRIKIEVYQLQDFK